MEVVGDIGIFESQRACAPLRRHLFGPLRFAQWYFVAAMLIGDLVVSWLFEKIVPGWGWFAVIVWTAAALFLWFRYARTLAPKAWMRRGVPASSEVVYRIEETGLVIASVASETRLSWSAISQIAPGHESWLFIGPGLAYFLPRRLFVDQAAEKAFLAACLEHLEPSARARSPEAVGQA